MKGKLIVYYKPEKDEAQIKTLVDFHFRLRDLESFFISPEDELIAMIGRVERVFEYEEELEEIMISELSGKK